MKFISKSISVLIVTVVSAAAVGSAGIMVYHAVSDKRSNIHLAYEFFQTHPNALAEFFGRKADAQLGKSDTREETPAHELSPTSAADRPVTTANCPPTELPTSLADYLATQGKAKDLEYRKSLAQSYGIANYTGSAAQNTALLQKLYEKDVLNCE